MTKGQACIVQGCRTTKRSIRHRFPKDPVKSYIWSCAIKNLELQEMSVEQRQKFYVCHQHFPQEAYKLTLSRCHLTDTAVPSLNIPEESSPTMECSEKQTNGQTEDISPGTSIRGDGVTEIQGEPVLPPNVRDEEQPDIVERYSFARENSILGSMKRQTSLDPKAEPFTKKQCSSKENMTD